MRNSADPVSNETTMQSANYKTCKNKTNTNKTLSDQCLGEGVSRNFQRGI